MNQVIADPMITALQDLLRTFDEGASEQDVLWRERLHFALGQLADAIQEEVRTADKTMREVGEMNPDLQNAPGTDRHFQSTREQLIKLNEQVYQLRADVRSSSQDSPMDWAQLRARGDEIRAAVEKVRQMDNAFVQETVNADLGSGE